MPIAPFTGADYTLLESLIQGQYASTGSWAQTAKYLTDAGYDLNNIEDLCRAAGVSVTKNAAGRVVGYEIPTVVQNTATALDSNTQLIQRGKVAGIAETAIDATTGKVTGNLLAGVGNKATTAVSKIGVPLAIASAAMFFGKSIDETLYNFNPDFWNSIGASSLNPDTWAASIIPDNELGQDVFNILFGIDPNNNQVQAYMDAENLAYLGYVLQEAGVFSSADIVVPEYGSSVYVESLDTPASLFDWWLAQVRGWANRTSAEFIGYRAGYEEQTDNMIAAIRALPVGAYQVVADLPPENFKISVGSYFRITALPNIAVGDTVNVPSTYRNCNSYTVSIVSSVDSQTDREIIALYAGPNIPQSTTYTGAVRNYVYTTPTLTAYGKYTFNNINTTSRTPIPGLYDLYGARQPDFTGKSQDEYLPYMQDIYPTQFGNALPYNVMQPDGTVDTHTYLPIPLPVTHTWYDTQPHSGQSTQVSPVISADTSTQEMLDVLTRVLQQPQPAERTDTDTGMPEPPPNPAQTGTGSAPLAPIPSGSAAALWSVYHPTQAQIDAFGSWLWSSNFVDQLLKIFNDPMQSIIGLHKIYAQPIDAGTSTIAVGYLDSQVPSAYVTQQYVTVDCGSVNLFEQFGNVFDYEPFTSVQLYLPCIGIVPLDVSQVMRSAISISYEVDIFTGACLAKVDISRDGGGGVLYQYSGDCAARYPISSGSYMGIVSGVVSMAGGIAATIATGGGAAPLALGAAGAAMSMHTDVKHSGGFSGNAGVMGGKIPYIIVTRPQTAVAYNVGHMVGYPANETERLGNCSGYVRVSQVHDLAPTGATTEEYIMIVEAITDGVIV